MDSDHCTHCCNAFDSNNEVLPKGWEKRYSRATGEVYYLNTLSKESRWDRPSMQTNNKDNDQIRCSHKSVKQTENRKSYSLREDEMSKFREEAIKELVQEYRKQIDSGKTTIEELAQQVSDSPPPKNGRDSGYFTRVVMLKPYEDSTPYLKEKPKNRLADVVQIVKNLNTENAELTERVNELTERVESLQTNNKSLSEQLSRVESVQKADIASMRTLIEILRKELEEFKSNFVKHNEEEEDDDESEV